jgi:hypothetical protein
MNKTLKEMSYKRFVGQNWLYAKLAIKSSSQISCSVVRPKYPPNMCHLPVHNCTDPFNGAAYSNVQVILMRSDDRSLEPTYQHVCLWQLLKMEAHCCLFAIVLTL